MLQTPQPDADKGGQPGARGIVQKWLRSLAYLMPSEVAQFLRSRFTKAGQADGASQVDEAASAAEPLKPTLRDLANQTDAVISREVREGCTGEIEIQLEDLRKA